MEAKQATALFNTVYEAIHEHGLTAAGSWLIVQMNQQDTSMNPDQAIALQRLYGEAQLTELAVGSLQRLCHALHRYLKAIQSLPTQYSDLMQALAVDYTGAGLHMETVTGEVLPVAPLLDNTTIKQLMNLLYTVAEFASLDNEALLEKFQLP